MLQNPNCRQNHETDLGVGRSPDVLPSLIDNPEGEFGGNRAANSNIEENLINGVPASPGVAVGPAAVIQTSEDLQRIGPNSILICAQMSPELLIVSSLIRGIISERGGVMSTSATIAREYGLPVVTAVRSSTSAFSDGDLIRVDGTRGSVQILSKATVFTGHSRIRKN